MGGRQPTKIAYLLGRQAGGTKKAQAESVVICLIRLVSDSLFSVGESFSKDDAAGAEDRVLMRRSAADVDGAAGKVLALHGDALSEFERDEVRGIERVWWNWRLDPEHYSDWDDLREEVKANGTHLLTYVNTFLMDSNTDKGLFYREAKASMAPK